MAASAGHGRAVTLETMTGATQSPLPNPRPAYSVTSLMVYEACPLQYYYAFVLGVPPPRTPGMIRGTNIHKLISNHYRQRELIPGTLEPDLQRLFEDFKRSRFNIAPVASEKAFTLSLGESDVRGRIDLVLPGEGGTLEVVDFKSGSPQDRSALSQHLQLPLYTLAVSEMYDREPGDLAYTYYFLRDGTEVSFTPTPQSTAATKDRVGAIIDNIQAGHFDRSPGCGCYACRRERRRPQKR